EHTIRNQRLIHVPIETRGVVADWNTANDDLVVYSSTQVPHFLRTFLAIVCGVSEAKVRAIAPDVGGGFGSKSAPRRCSPPATAAPRSRTCSSRRRRTGRCSACAPTTSRTTAHTCRC